MELFGYTYMGNRRINGIGKGKFMESRASVEIKSLSLEIRKTFDSTLIRGLS